MPCASTARERVGNSGIGWRNCVLGHGPEGTAVTPYDSGGAYGTHERLPFPPPSQADLLPCWTLVLPQQRKPRARPRFLHGGAVSGSRPPPQGFGPTRVALLPHGPRWATQWPIHRPCLTRWHGASPPQVWDVAELKQRGKLTGHRAPVVGARIEQGFVLTADRRGVVCVHLEGELAPSLFHRPWRKREASSLRRPFL